MKLLIRYSVALIIFAIVAISLFSWMKQQPLYRPGQAAKLDLTGSTAGNDSSWPVADGIVLNHFASGSGRNILYIHGGPGIPTGESAPAFDALADEFKVHYYDQRGTGRSTRPFDVDVWSDSTWPNIQKLEGTLGIAQQLADIERIRRILGDEKLILVGHSYGALLASLYAAEFPEQVERLILIAPADLLVFPSPYGDFFKNIRNRLSVDLQAEYDAWQTEYFDLGSIFTKTTVELESLDARFGEFFGQAIGAVPEGNLGGIGVWHVRAQYFSLGQRHDWREAISAYPGPVLILHGEQDVQTIEVSQMYAKAFSKARVQTISSSGHFPHYTQPEETTDALRHFLTENEV